MDTENTILKQIQQNLDALQKQIDSMKPADTPLEIPKISGGLYDRLKEKAKELTQIMRDINAGGTGIFMSAVFSVNGAERENLSETAFYSMDSADVAEKAEKTDENKISSAFEPFASPKRINILKSLMIKKSLSSNELTMKTGCIGGQLYHHLSILETANIVCKTNELYTLTDYGRNMTNIIFCIIFGERA